MRLVDKLRHRNSKVLAVVLGGVVGLGFNYVLEPLLYGLVYRNAVSFFWAAVIVGGGILIMVSFGEKHPLGLSRKQGYRMFSIGVSGVSFLLALVTFLRYPVIMASTAYGWLVAQNWIVGGVSMGSLVFFVASILWDTLIGSFFAFFEKWFNFD